MSETCVKSEHAEAIQDYLMNGGSLTDIQVPMMYLKKLFVKESLILYDVASNAQLTTGAPPKIKKLIDMLKEMILDKIPR